MPPKTITCPDCGLVLRLTRNEAGSALINNLNEWQAHCKRPHRDDPAWCLIRRDGSHPRNSGSTVQRRARRTLWLVAAMLHLQTSELTTSRHIPTSIETEDNDGRGTSAPV
jgi:hypothetical protein